MGLLDQYFDPEIMAQLKQLNQPSADDRASARSNALMNAGFSMMMNNQGRDSKQALFNALGAGGMAGLGSYNNAIEDARARQQQSWQQGVQMSQLMEQMRQKKSQQEAIAQLPQADQQAIAAGVPYKDIYAERNKGYTLSPGDQRFAGGQMVAGLPTKPELKEGYIVSDGNGGFKIDPTLYDAALKRDQARSIRINMPVSVNTEKTWSGNVAEGLAKNDVAALEAAQTAGERIQNARRVRNILEQNPITGTAAEWRLSANKALSTAGIIDGQQVKSTEDLASILANQTLDAIKTSGLGSGQGFTDKDRQFLERAKSGNIEMNAGTLRYLSDLNERAGVATINRGNEVAGRLKSHPSMGSIGQSYNFKVPDDVRPLPAKPNAQSLRKGTIYETPKGNLRWNGLQFEDM